MAPGKLLFESVRRFKGQQAPAIVLVERLEVLVKADNPLNGPFLNRG